MSHLEAVNAAAALRTWAPLKENFVHLFIDNVTTVVIFQLCWGRDSYTQAFARHL